MCFCCCCCSPMVLLWCVLLMTHWERYLSLNNSSTMRDFHSFFHSCLTTPLCLKLFTKEQTYYSLKATIKLFPFTLFFFFLSFYLTTNFTTMKRAYYVFMFISSSHYCLYMMRNYNKTFLFALLCFALCIFKKTLNVILFLCFTFRDVKQQQ